MIKQGIFATLVALLCAASVQAYELTTVDGKLAADQTGRHLHTHPAVADHLARYPGKGLPNVLPVPGTNGNYHHKR